MTHRNDKGKRTGNGGVLGVRGVVVVVVVVVVGAEHCCLSLKTRWLNCCQRASFKYTKRPLLGVTCQ